MTKSEYAIGSQILGGTPGGTHAHAHHRRQAVGFDMSSIMSMFTGGGGDKDKQAAAVRAEEERRRYEEERRRAEAHHKAVVLWSVVGAVAAVGIGLTVFFELHKKEK